MSTGTPTPGTFTQVHFPDNISRWCYIHYDPSLSLLSEAGVSGTITAYYSNYNTSSGVLNKASKTFNGFSAAGIPSTSTDASFLYKYPDASLNTNNVDIAVNVVNTTPYSNGSAGPWIDKEYKEKTNYYTNLSPEKKKEYARTAYLNKKEKINKPNEKTEL